MSLFPFGVAMAQDSGPIVVDTEAVVDAGSGAAPTVHYKFELQTEPDGAANVAGPWSDDPIMYPNLEDDPLAHIGYWWIASHPAGIGALTDGFVRVFHPDGTLKYQLHGAVMDCAALGNEATPGSVLAAAIASGQFLLSDAADLRSDCDQNQVQIYHVFGEISKHQPCGLYEVRATAVGQGGANHTLVNTMEVGCIVGLEIDFTEVDYGQIIPGTSKWIDGDWVFSPGTKPTVLNTGNTNMFLQLEFSAMVGTEFFDKEITEFDATLRWRLDPTDTLTPSTIQTYPTIFADTPVCFNEIPLGSNEIGKLDLSIHPPLELPADTYAGTLELTGWFACPPPPVDPGA